MLIYFSIELGGILCAQGGVAGREGIVRNPKGKIVIKYAWGLGKKTKNQAEMYELYIGLLLAL